MIGKANLVAAVSCVVIGGLGIAAQADDQQLQQEVASLRTQVSQLQQQAQGDAEMAATVDQILRDAESRTQFMADGDSGAGYDGGFYIRSGSFVMKPGFVMQVRNITDYRESDGGSDEIENGFEVRRMQLSLQGTAITKELQYFFLTETARDGGTVSLQDAYIKYALSDQFTVRAGQFKEQFSHEKILSDSKTLAVDRSLLDAAIGGSWTSRIQGVNLIYGGQAKDNPWNLEVGLNDGSNSINTDYVGHYPSEPGYVDQVKAPGGHDFDWGMTARAEYKVMGDWKSYGDMNLIGVKEDMLVFGAGLEMNQGGDGDTMAGTIDAAYKMKNGWSLYAAGMVRTVESEISQTSSDETNWGMTTTLSYLINPAMEAFARYSYVSYDNDVASANNIDNFHEVAIGMAYYLGKGGEAGNRAKLTVDLTWLPSGVPTGMNSYGFYGDSVGEDEIVLRGMFQLML